MQWTRKLAAPRAPSCSPAPPCNMFEHRFLCLYLGFASSRVRMRGSNMNLITLANCPTEPAHAQWISLNPHREWMNFAHLCIMWRQRRHRQSKISGLIQTGPLPSGQASCGPLVNVSMPLDTFLAQVEAEIGARLSKFVKEDFDAFLECGILAHGFLRLRWL